MHFFCKKEQKDNGRLAVLLKNLLSLHEKSAFCIWFPRKNSWTEITPIIQLTMRRPDIVDKIRKAVRSIEPTATSILYGSEARGDARPDSDVDVLILLEGEKRDLKKENAISGALYDIELATGIIVSPMITLRKLWEGRPFDTPFYQNVTNEGIIL